MLVQEVIPGNGIPQHIEKFSPIVCRAALASFEGEPNLLVQADRHRIVLEHIDMGRFIPELNEMKPQANDNRIPSVALAAMTLPNMNPVTKCSGDGIGDLGRDSAGMFSARQRLDSGRTG